MNAATEKKCPDQGTLSDFLQGKLVPPELEDCVSHVEVCDSCHETLRGITPSDTLSEYVATAMEPSLDGDDADVVDALVRRLSNQDDLCDTANRMSSQEAMRNRAAEVLFHVTPDAEEPEGLGLLAGFRLLELIGAGGTGVVFRAHDLSLNREVALKVLRPSLGDLACERFVTEAQAAASISHENVVTIYQVGQQDRLAWISMQWIPGETLESRLTHEGALREEAVRQLATQIARGLAEAHRQQLVHRDIKPANLWIGGSDEKVRILDFGLARVTDNDPALTATGMLAGTPSFMSPEQARGQELDARSDLFSLGCVIYQMITGKLPFEETSILGTLQAIQEQHPEVPADLSASCSAELSDLTMALLEKEPADRLQSADVLERCLNQDRAEWPVKIRKYVSSDRPTVARKTQSAMRGRASSRVWSTLALLVFCGWVIWLFSPQIIRIATNQGQLVIETEDENVSVNIRENGELIRVLDGESGASFDVRSGKFEISAVGKDGKTEFHVTPNQIVIRRGEQEVLRVTKVNEIASAQGPKADPNPTELDNADGLPLVYQGKGLTEWLQILKSDQSSKTQAEALNASVTLYASAGRDEELTSLLNHYVKQHANKSSLYKDKNQFARFSGFSESMQQLPIKKRVLLLESHVREGSEATLAWVYLALVAPNLKDQGLLLGLKHPSVEVKRELESRSHELLNLIAQRQDCDALTYLFELMVKHILTEPYSDETLAALKGVFTKFSPTTLLSVVEDVPKSLLAPEVFSSTREMLFSKATSAEVRDDLVTRLIDVDDHFDGELFSVKRIFADVIANQFDAAEAIEFDKFQTMVVEVKDAGQEAGKVYWPDGSRFSFSRIERINLNDRIVVTRRLLTAVCEGLPKAFETDATKAAESAAILHAIIVKHLPDASEMSGEDAELVERIQIRHDLDTLEKLSQKASGEFSRFLSRPRDFE